LAKQQRTLRNATIARTHSLIMKTRKLRQNILTTTIAARLSLPLASALASLLGVSLASAQTTHVWANSNVTGLTPAASLNWFNATQGTWTGGTPVSGNTNTIQFFQDTTTALPNTGASGNTQASVIDNAGAAFQLGALTLSGLASATTGANLTMNISGDALNFSAATGTINLNALNATRTITYNVNGSIQLGTASSGSALTLTGNGTSAFNFGGPISELQAGGGSLIKSGTSAATLSGALSFTGGITVNAGTLTASNNTVSAANMTVNNGGTLVLTGNLTPASGSMTVNSGGILQIGNNTATQFGPLGVYSGNISTGTGGTLLLRSTSAQELSGIISGSGGINKGRSGTLTLSGANTYTGKSVFQPLSNGANFQVNVSSFNSVVGGTASSSLGAPTTVANGTIDIGGVAQAGVTLNYTGSGETTDRVVAVAWNANSTQTIQASGSGLLNFTSPFTAASSTGTGNLVLAGAGNGQVNGITGSINSNGLSKTGTGTWTISGPSNFTQATTITGGILNLSHSLALQNSPFSTASSVGTASLGLRTSVTTLTLGGLTGSNALDGRFTTALGGPLNATAKGGYDGLTNLTLNTVAGTTSTYTGAIVEGAVGMTLTKTGAGIQTITSANSYTGTTFVNGGYLQLNGSTLAGGLSVSSNAIMGSNSTFAGLSTVTSGTLSPGASLGAIGQLTINNASSSALTLTNSAGIFDLPSTVTTPDQISVTGGGGLVLNGTNTVVLQTATAGTPAGTYDLMTFTGTHTGAGSVVFADGSTTRGNASLSVSAGLVRLTVATGGLAGTTTFNGAGGTGNTTNWDVAARWNTGVVPTGAVNVTLAPTGAQGVTVNAAIPTYTGDLMINPGVTLQLGWTTNVPTAYNALGTSGSTIIFMGAGSQIRSRNGASGTFSDIALLGDANVSLGESTQAGMAATFRSITGPYEFNLYTHGNGGPAGSANFTMANSFSVLNLSGSGPLNANASGALGTAKLNLASGFGTTATLNINHSSALADNSNPITFNNGTLIFTNDANVTAPLTLSTRPIELNGTGQATINNNNVLSSNANILTIGGNLLVTGTGAKTLTLGGTNTGRNLFSGNIVDGTGAVISVAKAGAGTWVLSGANTYTGSTTIPASGGILAGIGANAFGSTSGISMSSGTLSLRGNSSTSFVKASDSTPYVITTTATGAIIDVAAATTSSTAKTMTIGAIRTSSTAATYQVSFTGSASDNTSLAAGAVTGPASTAAGAVTFSNTNTTGTVTLASYSGANTSGGETLTFSGDGSNTTVTGNVLKSATNMAVTKSGTGILTLSGAGNTFNSTMTLSGTTTSAGTLAYASAGGANPITFTATTGFGSTLDYIGSSALTMSGAITTSALTTGGVQFNANGSTSAATIHYSNTASIGTSTSTSTRFITLGGANTGDNIFAGAINNNTGVGGLASFAKNGVGKWVLTGNSNFSGGLFINQGTISANSVGNSGVSGNLGAGTRIALGRENNAGTLIFTGAGSTTNRDTRIGTPNTLPGTGGGAILNNGTGALTFTASTFNITQTLITDTRTLTLGGSYTGGVNEVQGVIQDNTASTGLVGVTKTGAGTWKLSGNSTYTGATTVNEGTLLVSGSLSGTSAVTVQNGGTLGSSSGLTGGTVGGVTIQSGGTLAPGASTGLMTSGNLSIQNGGIFAVENNYSSGTITAGTDYDQMTVNGTITLGATSTLSLSGSYLTFPAIANDLFFIMLNDGIDTVDGTFNGLSEGSTVTALNGQRYLISYQADFSMTNSGNFGTAVGNDIALLAVPEPSSVALLGLGVFGLMRRRRRES
jgi:fibronectin-binding autotransporter adhesin